MQRTLAGLLLALFGILLCYVSISSLAPTELSTEAVPTDRFSAQRALDQLRVVARLPHAAGTEEHGVVRQYLVNTARELGLEVEVQSGRSAFQRLPGLIWAAESHNVVAKLRGRTVGRKALLLMAHYDTVPVANGAADDGSGVVTLLEVMRAMAAGPVPANDVIFLFTDLEEGGLHGAQVFVEQHPNAGQVGMVLNFEARGNGGPSLMFQTSPGNGPLIRALQAAAPAPVAGSYSAEIYRRLPNDTDFTRFLQRDYLGMNFAFIHGPSGYHTALDTVERLDPRSLQHQGDNTLALTRHFAEADLSSGWQGGDAIYFNLPVIGLVVFPASLAMPLAVMIVLLVLVALVMAWRRRRAGPGRVILATLYQAVVVVFGGVVLWALGQVLLARPYAFELWGGRSSTTYVLFALLCLGLAYSIMTMALGCRMLGAQPLLAGTLVLWSALTVVVTLSAPGASYLLALPLLFTMPLVFRRLGQDGDSQAGGSMGWILGALAVAAATLLWAPTLALLGVAMPPMAAGIYGAVLCLVVGGLLIPVLELLGRARILLAVLALVLGLGLAAATESSSVYDEKNPRPSTMVYVVDVGQAWWFSYDLRPDDWAKQFLGNSPERVNMFPWVGWPVPVWRAPAPASPLEGAQVELLAEEDVAGQGRRLDLRVRWSNPMHRAKIFLRSNDDLAAVTLAGQRIEPAGDAGFGNEASQVICLYVAPPEEGIRMQVEVSGQQPLVVEVTGQRYGLPELVFFPWEPRPADEVAGGGPSGWDAESTYVHSQTRFNAGAGTVTPEEGAEQDPAAAEAIGTQASQGG